MLGPALKEAGGIAGNRSVLSTLLPSLVFGVLVVLLVAATENTRGLTEAVQSWNGQPLAPRVLQVGVFLGAVCLTAMFLTAALGSLLRLYEGYWRRGTARLVAELGRRAHREKIKRLHASGGTHADNVLYRRYPSDPGAAMPTSLGNVLRGAEDYTESRYGIAAPLFWPRLYHLLPESITTSVGSIRTRLDAMLAVSFLGGVLGTAGAVYLVARSAAWAAILLCWWSGHLLACLTYRAATVHAIILAEHIKVSFDLYRHTLAEQIHDELPDGHDNERNYWITLAQFWFRGADRDFADYTTTSEHVPQLPEHDNLSRRKEIGRLERLRHASHAWFIRQTLTRWFALLSIAVGLVSALVLP